MLVNHCEHYDQLNLEKDTYCPICGIKLKPSIDDLKLEYKITRHEEPSMESSGDKDLAILILIILISLPIAFIIWLWLDYGWETGVTSLLIILVLIFYGYYYYKILIG